MNLKYVEAAEIVYIKRGKKIYVIANVIESSLK